MYSPLHPDRGTDAADTMDTVTLQFRRDQQNSGGQIRIEYDPTRLVSEGEGWAHEIVCHVRFQPSGEQLDGLLLEAVGSVRAPRRAPRPLVLTVRIPSGADGVDIWFESRGPAGSSAWDSRYGRNYAFAVSERGLSVPEHSVAMRPCPLLKPVVSRSWMMPRQRCRLRWV